MQDFFLFGIIYIKRYNFADKRMSMKKNVYLWLCALVLTIAGLSSCSDDDSFNDIIGTWYLVSYNDGWGNIKKYNDNEIIVTFTRDGKVNIVNNREDQRPLPTGTRTYSFKEVAESIYTHERSSGITFDGSFIYSYYILDGMLHISAEAYDGPGYGLRKVTK